jgi:hypothetical protein
LSKTGIVRLEALKEHCKVTDGRIKNYVREGYAEKILYKDGKEIKEAYALTKKGRELAEKQWALRDHYHAQTKSPYHGLTLSDKYFSLSEQIRDTWRTETKVREQFLVKLREVEREDKERANLYYKMMEDRLISMPDGVYTSETGVEIAYEVVTDSYGRQEILANNR